MPQRRAKNAALHPLAISLFDAFLPRLKFNRAVNLSFLSG